MAKNSRIIDVKCPGCKNKIFKYKKVGKGNLLRCWKNKIITDNSIREGDKIKCTCGKTIGIDKGKYIKMERIQEIK
ncbi:MAG: hypothetical protein KGY75_02925 [Candidatus Cloacimonetes bacterium]|nr:hypothetical protein [Candidatus Cloacimonadota bacterium]MBS3767061.1 hypothetical protein [Candidatus Cloacimonadota bacterium]